MVINKCDVEKPSYKDSYLALLKKQVKEVVEISALREQHLKTVVDKIFKLLPEGERDSTVDYFPTPLLSQSSSEYLAEIIREKVFQHTGQEVPYQTAVRVTSVEEDEEEKKLVIKGEILVSDKRYKPMLIGKKGQKIAEIRKAARKELEIATDKQVHVKLIVVVR